MEGKGGPAKDWWDKAQIIISALIPLAIALVGFLVSKSMKQEDLTSTARIAAGQQTVQETNVRVAQAQLVLTFLKSLTSRDPRERQISIAAVKRALPRDADDILESISETDPDPEVRQLAKLELQSPVKTETPPQPPPRFRQRIGGYIRYYSNGVPVAGVTVRLRGWGCPARC